MRKLENILFYNSRMRPRLTVNINRAVQEISQQGRYVAVVDSVVEFLKLIPLVGPGTRIDINSHGNKDKSGNHCIEILGAPAAPNGFVCKTSGLFGHIADISKDESWENVQIHLWSCYAGAAINAINYLPKKSTLITHSGSDVSTPTCVIERNIISGLMRKSFSPAEEFMHVISESAGEITIAKNTGSNLQPFLHRRVPLRKVLKTYDETRQHVLTQCAQFQTEYNEHFTDSPLTQNTLRVVEEKLSDESLDAYCNEAAFLRAHDDHDTSYIQAYLEQKMISPDKFKYMDEYLMDIAISHMKYDHNFLHILEFLSANHVDFNKPRENCYHFSPLCFAAMRSNIPFAKFLLDHGADVNGSPESTGSPILLAVSHNRVEMVAFLLSIKGHRLKHISDALEEAKERENSEIIKLLENMLENARIETSREFQTTKNNVVFFQSKQVSKPPAVQKETYCGFEPGFFIGKRF